MLFSELTNFLGVFFSKKVSIHPISVVLIAEMAQYFECSVTFQHADGRMCDAIEGVRLHRRVVNHILENDLLADLQFVVKLPIAHKVATQTTVAT